MPMDALTLRTLLTVTNVACDVIAGAVRQQQRAATAARHQHRLHGVETGHREQHGREDHAAFFGRHRQCVLE